MIARLRPRWIIGLAFVVVFAVASALGLWLIVLALGSAGAVLTVNESSPTTRYRLASPPGRFTRPEA